MVSKSVVSGVVVLLGVSAVEAVGVQRRLINETRNEKLIKIIEHRSFPSNQGVFMDRIGRIAVGPAP